MPHRLPLLLAVAAVAPLLVPAGPPLCAEETAVATAVEIERGDLEHRLHYVASEALAGRETTKPGAAEAAHHVASEFERAGLQPHGDDGTWFQEYTVPRPVLGDGNLLRATIDDEADGGDAPATDVFEVETDWNPFSVSASGEARGSLVFAGYGITAPGRNWDDYAGLDVQGKIVLVFRKDPGWGDRRHAAFLSKLSNAAAHGAAALLLCNNPATTGDGEDRIGHWSAMLGAATGSGKIPYAFVSQDTARTLLSPLGATLTELERALRSDGPSGRDLPGVQVEIRTAISGTRETNARNVVGFLEGTDPSLADEVVVLGAHFDHVGLGYFGSLGGAAAAGTIHPGADDNGSGTVALLELAEYFGAHRPARSLLFLAFSGEEMGLLGSRHYVEHPVIPLAHVVAMINMDMVGRSRAGQLQVGGVGTGRGLKEIVALANTTQELVISWDPQGSAPSDSTSFFRKKIPVLFFFTGIHEDYHRPSDTPDRINYDDMERVVRLVRDTTVAIADRSERIVYTDPPPVPRPPRIGIQLAAEADPRGVAVGGVQPAGPAAEAGVEAGDVIVALAGQVVRGVPDLRNVLARLKPGKPVELIVLRGDDRVVLEIIPAERRRR
ncbi:MAG: M28 family peptidase [Planctomycetota bacterium]|jgi:hypothetical protein